MPSVPNVLFLSADIFFLFTALCLICPICSRLFGCWVNVLDLLFFFITVFSCSVTFSFVFVELDFCDPSAFLGLVISAYDFFCLCSSGVSGVSVSISRFCSFLVSMLRLVGIS